jgi:predicted membrane protein
MKKLIIALLLGIAAGVIDVIPIFIMSAILGSLIGFFSVFIEKKLKVVENNG